MKHIFNGLCLSLLLVAAGSCKKDENKIYYEDGTPPVLSANVTTAIPMSFATQGNEAVKLSWTNPDYKFTTGVSSQTVSYQIEIDTTGSNFTNPKRQTVAISAGLERSFLQSELNEYLLNQLQLLPEMSHNVEMRVKAFLGTNSLLLASNVLKFTVTPYTIPPKVAPPASGNLYITGGATPGGWQCACGEPELLSQKFTQVSPTLYVLNNITLSSGQSYLLLPVYGSWDAKFGGVKGNNENNVDGDDFKAGGSDLKAPAVSGNYKIEVDFQRGKFTVTKL